MVLLPSWQRVAVTIRTKLITCLHSPGIFRGALDANATDITEGMKLAAAIAIAESVTDAQLSPDFVVPSVFDRTIVQRVAPAVAAAALKDGVIRKS